MEECPRRGLGPELDTGERGGGGGGVPAVAQEPVAFGGAKRTCDILTTGP